jgi:putative ABC transport system permease protein
LIRSIEDSWRDLRQAVRAIGRMPVLASVIVLSLAIGIGVNTVVFSWIEARVFKPLPGVAGSAGFHWIEPRTDSGTYPGMSWLEYRDVKDQVPAFRDLLAFRMVPLYMGEAGRVERAYGLLVSENYFSALGLRPALGRFLRPDEVARPGGEPVAVISYGLWQSHFGAAPDAIGRTLRLNSNNLTVIGVTPREFQGTVAGLNFDIWLPATMAPVMLPGSRELDDRAIRGSMAMGTLQAGYTLQQAQTAVDAAMRRLAQTYPETNATVHGEVLTFSDSPRGPQRLLNTALGVLQAIMLLLLLAVCGNTANLMLARASARQREMGVRLALGASPRRIASLLLTENLVLAIAGAALGAVIAVWGTPALVILPLTGLPIRFQTSVDGVGLAFAIGLGLASGVIFGAPALQLGRVDPQTALRSGVRTSGRSALRNSLMAVQVGLALIVLIVAGLFFRSVMESRDTDPGFRRDGVLLAAYDLTGRPLTSATTRQFAAKLLDRLRAAPGVSSAAIATSVPLDIHGLPSRAFTVEGHTRTEAGGDETLVNTVTPDYFRTMGIAFVAGRDFTDLTDVTTAPQAIVNDAFVRRFLGNAEPLGRRISARGRTFTIAGVVRTSISNAFGEPPAPVIYFAFRDLPSAGGEIHVRARAGAEIALAPEIRRAVAELDAELPVFNVRTLTDHIETNLVFRRVPARLFSVLGPLLLILAAIGIYAVVAYTVSLRTTEIGVRLALGATARRIVGQFVGESLIVIALGALAGWAIALVLAMDVVPGGAVDIAVFTFVPALLLVIAAVASWLPARRATIIEPIAALRQE